jgi:hypothetical protein
MPERLPDELLFSWLSRSHAHHGSPDPVTFTRSLFGSRRIASPYDLPGNLQLLSSCLPTSGNLTAEMMLWDMTLFPYYAAFADRENRAAAMAALLEGEGIKGRALLGMNSRSHKLLAFRFCPECREEDLAEFGEIYWRRAFQVEAALACPRHSRMLLASDCQPAGKYRFQAASVENCRDDAVPVASTTDAAVIERLASLASAVQRFLANPPPALSRLELREAYRRRIAEVGIARTRGDKYGAALNQAMQDHWGRALGFLGPQAETDDEASWPTRLATSNYGHSVVRHLLLGGLLDAAQDGRFRRDRPFGDGPWVCENPLADHGGTPTIATCKLGRSYGEGARAGIFECSCGYVYTRRLMRDGTVKAPVRQSWGPLLAPYLQACAAKGIDASVVAARLGCTVKTVRKLAAHCGVDMGVSHQVYQDSWATTHVDGPRRRRSRPREDCSRRHQRGQRGRDWDAFDSDLAVRLAAANAEILSSDLPVRVTLKALAARVGEWPSAVSSNLHRMPQVSEVLRTAVETKPVWDSRRALLVVRFLRANWASLPDAERLRLLASPGVRHVRALDRESGNAW